MPRSIRLKKLGPDHTDVATTYSKLGYIHMQLGDLERDKGISKSGS